MAIPACPFYEALVRAHVTLRDLVPETILLYGVTPRRVLTIKAPTQFVSLHRVRFIHSPSRVHTTVTSSGFPAQWRFTRPLTSLLAHTRQDTLQSHVLTRNNRGRKGTSQMPRLVGERAVEVRTQPGLRQLLALAADYVQAVEGLLVQGSVSRAVRGRCLSCVVM